MTLHFKSYQALNFGIAFYILKPLYAEVSRKEGSIWKRNHSMLIWISRSVLTLDIMSSDESGQEVIISHPLPCMVVGKCEAI